MEKEIVVIVSTCRFPGYWGRGKTIAEAKANARRAGAKPREKLALFILEVPAGEFNSCYITDDAMLVRHSEARYIINGEII